MSQESSLTQSRHSVRQALTAYIQFLDGPERGSGARAWPDHRSGQLVGVGQHGTGHEFWLLMRVEIGHIRMGSAGNGRIKSRGSGSPLSQRT